MRLFCRSWRVSTHYVETQHPTCATAPLQRCTRCTFRDLVFLNPFAECHAGLHCSGGKHLCNHDSYNKDKTLSDAQRLWLLWCLQFISLGVKCLKPLYLHVLLPKQSKKNAPWILKAVRILIFQKSRCTVIENFIPSCFFNESDKKLRLMALHYNLSQHGATEYEFNLTSEFKSYWLCWADPRGTLILAVAKRKIHLQDNNLFTLHIPIWWRYFAHGFCFRWWENVEDTGPVLACARTETNNGSFFISSTRTKNRVSV